MAKIKPTLSITANSNTFTTVADRGPVSSPIELQSFVDVSVDDFLMFAKDMAVNNNSLTGYYAKVEMENTSTEPIELFALSSEATHSSK